ncbi:bacillolysin/thermolysin/neutral peptidase B [Cytobacillus firmus]|uniref:Neutral metalloproteinase n=2 Tax=Cytobacillus TaxID=2675230 RepID=A0A366JUA9_CYTFI|nr:MULTISPECIES: M4 family metallopeptidase [Cytobacillus]RBP90744.1 bacillolysin/thermolysin/neutral peptidase B [Cytobacillus firmus]TDX46326.1 bacillolysin/thermolysin/neutral peptidase B [Cytobacillus oceanisediminis]
MKKKLLAPLLLSSALLAGSIPVNVFAQPAESGKIHHIQASKEWNEKANVPLFVKERFAEKFSSSSPSNALTYLKKHQDKTGIKNPEKNLKVKDVQKDDLGMTHVRFNQTINGLAVEGSEVIVHYNKHNEVVIVNGRVNQAIANDAVNTSVSISSDAAIKEALSAVIAPPELTYEPESELVVYPFEGKNHTAYKVNVSFMGDEPGNWFVFVDAKTGNIIDKYNGLMHAEENKTQKGFGKGVHGDHRELHISRVKEEGSGTKFALADYSHENLDGIFTFDSKNDWDSNNDAIYAGNSAAFIGDYDRAAVDAHYNSERVYEYFLNEHGRNSLDGEGMAINSYVHMGTDYNNAFWNGRYMAYGDGDGEFFISLSAGLDVAAHEMTHGVITHTANLAYRNQSGALNESFADVFGVLVDDGDWEMGEDIMAPAAKADGVTRLRSLSDPNSVVVSNPQRAAYGSGVYPAHMDEYYDMPLNVDNGGVHVNSSITNHAAYLIGQELGREKLGKIYYRALTVYLTSNSDFSDARLAIVQSAIDLYGEGSGEESAVNAGFDAVGIY